MIGESGRVPHVSHNFNRKKWEAVTRILCKGFIEYSYFPVKLSQSFLLSCLFGEKAISKSKLLESFKLYVSKDEAKIISRCMSDEISLDDCELIEFFRF